MLDLNAPAVVAAIAALHDAYERALAANDVPALDAFFWDSPHVVRYGVAEHLYGAAALAAYRRAHTPAFTARRVVRREILALGPAVASVMCEIEQVLDGEPRPSRQSQVWALFPAHGWKIVAAHVSTPGLPASGEPDWPRYVDQAAAALRLPLDPAHRPGVVAAFRRTAALAAPLLAFPLPVETEVAAVFTP